MIVTIHGGPTSVSKPSFSLARQYWTSRGFAIADAARVAIRGDSAGGFTTLAALAFTDRFKAGANYFGVADIAALAATSHKFERKYDVSLIGPPDEALYRSRSPLFHLEGFTEPLITFQGAEDRIVTPDQSRQIMAALDAQGVMHAYFEFEGEQHGFRKAENIHPRAGSRTGVLRRGVRVHAKRQRAAIERMTFCPSMSAIVRLNP